MKQALADMEEKVQYQSDERLRDVNEVLENCQTRVSRNLFLLIEYRSNSLRKEFVNCLYRTN